MSGLIKGCVANLGAYAYTSANKDGVIMFAMVGEMEIFEACAGANQINW
jgi:hypothetical protein